MWPARLIFLIWVLLSEFVLVDGDPLPASFYFVELFGSVVHKNYVPL